MAKNSFPTWYNPRFMANPFFQPNEAMICGLAQGNLLADRSNDKVRTLVLAVDYLNSFTFPPTFVDPLHNGRVTRVLPLVLRDELVVPNDWVVGNNILSWSNPGFPLGQFVARNISMFGGHLSVPNGWIAVRDAVEWCLKNVGNITDYALLRDCHRVTSRWNMHYWVAISEQNPYSLKIGEHPRKQSDTEFFVLTPEMVWHSRHNESGWLRPVYESEIEVDEAYALVKGVGFLVLWDIHCTDGTIGVNIDPLFMATVLDHAYRRHAEPDYFNKAVSRRTESFGIRPAYRFFGDISSRVGLSFRDLLDGGTTLIGRPYDQIIVFGLADTHCVPAVLLDAVAQLENCGREHLAKRIFYAKPFCRGIPGFEQRASEQEVVLRDKGVRILTDPDEIFV